MSSELVKKLEDREQTLRENLFYESAEEYDQGYIRGFFEAMGIVEKYETQQMKEPLDKSSQIALDQAKDIYLRSKANWELVIYGIDKHSHAKKSHVISRLAEWAIEQEKLEEEK
ncbi:hypothetical protein L1A97_04515 [Listeria monocytogenes]|uniref:hypothetical protein n=1 Tax=Listeria monocytogenes TaxID=1639 RepID=UPI00207AEF6F|nr:hypothetical protein [Listeria monocytogenes]MCM8889318.1 hypothetical protein [Listeria monocytogenes]